MKLSAKKKNELYEAVYQEIMTARINIHRKLKNNELDKVDDILSDLCASAPLKAIQQFKD